MTVVGQWARGEVDLEPRDHPAPYSTGILQAIDAAVTVEADRLGRRLSLLDPMGGVGRLHMLGEAGHRVVTMDLEPEWAMQAKGPVAVADAARPPVRPGAFDGLVCSPVYPSRMTDHHEAKDLCNHTVKRKDAEPKVYGLADCPKCKGRGLSPRRNYRHMLERMPSRGSAAVLGWNPAYRGVHSTIAAAQLGCVRPGGLVVWNTSNHTRTIGDSDTKRVEELRVNEWWLNQWMMLGCNIVSVERVPTRRFRNGANRDARVDGEVVMVLRTPA